MNKQVKTLSTVEVLSTLDDGGALEEIREAITQVTKAVNERGGKGSVSLTLKFEKLGRKQLTISDAVKAVVPPVVKDPTMFFCTDEGALSRQNTDQLTMEDVSA